MHAAMAKSPHILERAFELARSGAYDDVQTIRLALAREGYEGVSAHLAGRVLVMQLRATCLAARRRLTE